MQLKINNICIRKLLAINRLDLVLTLQAASHQRSLRSVCEFMLLICATWFMAPESGDTLINLRIRSNTDLLTVRYRPRSVGIWEGLMISERLVFVYTTLARTMETTKRLQCCVTFHNKSLVYKCLFGIHWNYVRSSLLKNCIRLF